LLASKADAELLGVQVVHLRSVDLGQGDLLEPGDAVS
jgi:hypothetical protein